MARTAKEKSADDKRAKQQRETFGKNLKQLREAAGLTFYALAKIAKMDAIGIERLESGEREAGWCVALRLAEALETTVDKFAP